MAEDFWPTLHQDPYALARLKKSVELADVKPGMKVLDVGCHHSEALQFLPSCKYWGIDNFQYDENTIVQDFDGGIKSTLKFDRILCLEVLEHLAKPVSTLLSIRDSLEEDGLLVVSLPNEASLFHRMRCLLGIVDGQCFQEGGKHLHLPSESQSRKFLSLYFEIVYQQSYIAPSARGSHQEWVGRILTLIPDAIHQYLADAVPSLFARGFIFVCKKK